MVDTASHTLPVGGSLLQTSLSLSSVFVENEMSSSVA